MLPLAINNYFYPEISIIAFDKYLDEDYEIETKLALEDFDCVIDHRVDDGSLIMQIAINTHAETKSPLPYYIKLRAIGLFELENGGKDFTDEKFLFSLNSAATILYGAVREKIHVLTSQMPYGSLPLPIQVINFERIPDEEQQNPSQD